MQRAAARATSAAATLAAIDAARRGELEKAQKSLKPGAKGARYDFAESPSAELVNALPSVAPAAASKPAPPRDSVIVRKAHDDAMKVLQTHY